MITRTIAIYFFCISILLSASMGDGIIAVFNGEAVTYFEVLSYNRYKEVQLSRHFTGKEFQEKLLDSRKEATIRFVDQKILLKEFKEKGYKIPEFLIEERIDSLIKEQSGGDRDAFKKNLRDNDLDWNEYRESLKDRVAVNMMLSQFVYGTIKLKEADIQSYIRENSASLTKGGKSRLALLMLKKNGKYADKLNETADKIIELLKQGEDFAKVVTIYSEGPAITKGGEVGWLDDKNVRKDCRKDVEALEVGNTTGIIKLDDGHLAIFKLLERQSPTDIWVDAEVREFAKKGARIKKQDEKYEEYMKSLRAKNIINLMF